jgi:cysteinyl-tRNA synthetase
LNRTRSERKRAGLLKVLGGTLGILQGDPKAFLQAGTGSGTRRGRDRGS